MQCEVVRDLVTAFAVDVPSLRELPRIGAVGRHDPVLGIHDDAGFSLSLKEGDQFGKGFGRGVQGFIVSIQALHLITSSHFVKFGSSDSRAGLSTA